MKCSYCDRDDSVCRIRKVGDLFFCPKHITRYYRGQDMNRNTIYTPNVYCLYSDRAEIVLCDKHGIPVARAIIDLEDVNKCSDYKWHLRRHFGDTDYVIASLPGNKNVHLHRFALVLSSLNCEQYGHKIN